MVGVMVVVVVVVITLQRGKHMRHRILGSKYASHGTHLLDVQQSSYDIHTEETKPPHGICHVTFL